MKGRDNMSERKTRKVLDICVEGVWLECILHLDTNRNPYKLYISRWDNGKHRKKLAEYQNFVSVIEHIRGACHAAHWGFKDGFGKESV